MKIKQGLMKRNELELNTIEIELEGTTHHFIIRGLWCVFYVWRIRCRNI